MSLFDKIKNILIEKDSTLDDLMKKQGVKRGGVNPDLKKIDKKNKLDKQISQTRTVADNQKQRISRQYDAYDDGDLGNPNQTNTSPKKSSRKLSNPSTRSSANLDSQQPISTTKKGQGSLFKDPGKDTRKRRKDKGTTRGPRTKKYGTKTPITGLDKANKEILDVTGKSAVRDAKKYSKGEYPKVGGGGLKPDIKKPNKGTTPVKVNVKKPINVDKIFSGAGNVKKGGIVPDKNISPKSKGTTPVKVNVKKSINVNKIFDKPKSPIKKTIGVKQSEVSKQAKEFTAKINKANVKVQKNYVGRKAVRIKDATLGKKTGSLIKGNLSFPGDRSGAYQATKSDIETRKGFTSRSGGLKADEKNPFVKRDVRKTRASKLGGDIYDQPKFDQKKFEKGLQQTKKSKTFKIPPDPFKGSRQKFASGSLGYKDPGKLLNYEFQPSRKPVSTASLDDAPRIKKRFAKLSQDIKDFKDRDIAGGPRKTRTKFKTYTSLTRQDVGMAPPDKGGKLALTPKQIERQRLTKDLRDRVAKRRNVATNMQANINKSAGTDKGTKAVKALKALNRKTRNMARAAETGKVFAPVKYDAAYAKKSLTRLGIGSGSKGGSRTNQNTFNKNQRRIFKKYGPKSTVTKNIGKNIGKNLLKGFGKKALRFTGNNALGLGLIGLTAYDMYRSSKAQGQSGPPRLNLSKDTTVEPIRLKGGKSIRSIPLNQRTKTDKELTNPAITSLSNKAFQQMKRGGRYENEKVYNYFKNNQNYKNRLRKLSQQQGKTVNPYGVDLSMKK